VSEVGEERKMREDKELEAEIELRKLLQIIFGV